MSEHTPDTDNARTPNAAPNDADGYAAAFRALQDDAARMVADLKARDATIAALTGERDSFKAQLDDLAKRDAEGRLVERLRNKLPHAEPLALRGVLAALAEAGKVDRYPTPEKLDEVAAATLALIGQEAPSLTRAPASGGGVNGAPVTAPQAKANPVRALFLGGR